MRSSWLAVTASFVASGVTQTTTEYPRWCGKVYEMGSPNLDPGGLLSPPAPALSKYLYAQVEPRHTVYVSSESTGEFLVNASVSSTYGQPLGISYNGTLPFDTLYFDIRIEDTDQLLVSDGIAIDAGAAVFGFDLTALEPRLTPYNVVLYGSPAEETSSDQVYSASTELYYLPVKTNGSMVKVDNLNGGMLVANNASNFTFETLLPFGFYTSCSGYLNYSIANVTAYKDLGLNAVNPVCAFTDGDLTFLYDWMDEANLWFQYDMRGSYSNLTSVAEQIPLIKDRSSFLGWYTADEPDGTQDPLNATALTYDLLKQQDPYHPTSLVLNCMNYHFDSYTKGADYIMTDPYPISINATWSRSWNTTVNATYGDSGCDDCKGELSDVSNRLDAFFDYQQWLGELEKPLWAVLQAFSGEKYWDRDPTTEETWAMMVLSFNHRSKAIMSWTFPASAVLEVAHGTMAKVATVSPVKDFLLGGQPTALMSGNALLDVAYWTQGSRVMVGLANLDYLAHNATVNLNLPVAVKSVVSQPWGSLSYTLTGNGTLQIHGLSSLATSFMVLEM